MIGKHDYIDSVIVITYPNGTDADKREYRRRLNNLVDGMGYKIVVWKRFGAILHRINGYHEEKIFMIVKKGA